MAEKDSNYKTIAILYDIENAPFEMLNYTLGKARRYQPCRTIVVSDWDSRPEQKRWEKLLRRPGFTFRQISRTFFGKNSLDSALYDSAKILYQEGVRHYFIITTDSDFVKIAELLNTKEKSYIIGIGTKQASQTLRDAYDEFLVYPPEENEDMTNKKEKKEAGVIKQKKASKKKMEQSAAVELQESSTAKSKTSPAKKAKQQAGKSQESGESNTAKKKSGSKKEKIVKENLSARKKDDSKDMLETKSEKHSSQITINLPRTLYDLLERRMEQEGVPFNELITYLLMRGLSADSIH